MASLTKESDRGRKGWRLRFSQNGKRRSLWIGDVSKRIADGISYNVDLLVQAKAAGQRPDAKAEKWATDIGGRIRDTLINWGLIDIASQPSFSVEDDQRKLGAFLDAYIEGRTDVSESTRSKYAQSRRFLVEFFTEDKQVASITASDAKKWKRWLEAYELQNPSRKMATSTAVSYTHLTLPTILLV